MRFRKLAVLASTAVTAAWLAFRTRPAPGRFARRIFVGHAGTRFYKLYLPRVYRGQTLPLVVMLHGCKQTPEDFALGTRMNEAADELGLIVAYPAQAWRANIDRCWNWFSARDQQRDHGEPAIIAGITRQVISRYKADAHRVYVAGLSAGGSMAGIVATAYPDVYAAVGIHSGVPYTFARGAATAMAAMRFKRLGTGAPPPSIPTIVFHGDGDTTVHPSNSEYAIAEGTLRRQTGSAGGRSYTRTTYPNLEHWLVHGAGHAWSGGNAAAAYADDRGPDATHEMLRFFLSQQPPAGPAV